MRERTLRLSAGFCVLVAMACGHKDSTAPTDSSDVTSGPFEYIYFRVTSGSPPKGGVFDVAVFEQVSAVRRELGSSLPDGNYATGGKLDASKKYRIEVYTLPNHDCVMAFWEVSLNTTPSLWTTDRSATPISDVGLGTPSHADGCWGP